MARFLVLNPESRAYLTKKLYLKFRIFGLSSKRAISQIAWACFWEKGPCLLSSLPFSIFSFSSKIVPNTKLMLPFLTLWDDMAQKCPSPWIVKEIDVLIIYEWIYFGTSDFRHNLVMINQVTRWSLPTPFTWWTLCYTLLHFVTWSLAPWWDHCYTVIGELTVTHGGTPVVTWWF